MPMTIFLIRKKIKMKKAVLAVCSVVAVLMAACSKDSKGLVLQNHDANRMMDTMDAMMMKMEAMQKTNDPEVDFAKMMIMHHQGAISMSNVQLQSGTNDSMKRTAQKIINTQQTEIQQFNTILAGITVDNTDMAFTMEQMENMQKMSKTADIQLITGNIDNDFATLMIVHHQAAIDNASAYLHHGNHAELKTMATKIVNSQTKEIKEMADWLKANKR